MASEEKSISYTSKNTYLTKNALSSQTKNIWLVFHGIGYLSRYFARYFNALDPTENYLVIPQAPSKYYLNNEYKYVGASWLTKENTAMEIENLMNYLDSVFEAERIPANVNLILFGFSQGVSIVTRWLAHKRIPCHAVILYAGGIPNELTAKDFEFMDWKNTSVKMVYGSEDAYLVPERLEVEKSKIEQLFQGHAEIITFNGGHEMRPELIANLIG